MKHFFLTFAVLFGALPEWPNGADCKSADVVFGGSNPSRPTQILSGSSSFGRAIAFQAIGGGFEPRLPLHLKADIAQG